jgi:hypothetical protein
LTDIAKEIDSRDDRAHYLPHVIPKPIWLQLPSLNFMKARATQSRSKGAEKATAIHNVAELVLKAVKVDR